MYSGHKQCKGIKFQSVVTPDGLFASMYGLVSGNRHDSFLLSNSGPLNKLQKIMPDDAPEDVAAVIYSLNGDSAYPQSIHIFGGNKNPADGSAHAHWNSQMSKVCEVAEWGFANILAQWSFLDFRVAMKIFQVLLPNITLLLLYLSIFKPVFMATKPWNTLSVKQCHLMNIYQ